MGRKAEVKVTEVAYHRNGVAGEGFHVVSFRNGRDPMVGVVFTGQGQVAVLKVADLAAGVVSMADGAAYRGDVFEPALRAAVARYDAAE